MVRMMALDKFPYGIPLRTLKFGDEFDCEPEHVLPLVLMGKAQEAESKAQEAESKGGYKTREITSEKDDGEHPKRTGRYRRSDMRAED